MSAISTGRLVRAHGVCYASARRFRPPNLIEKWDGIMDCTGPSPICPQTVPSRLDSVTVPITARLKQDENCLHVTVTTTSEALSDGSKRPVMVYLHGGAYISGGADLDCYQLSGLVDRGVAGVNISYRLGIFGYQPIPSLAPANLGLLSQIEGLRWVQQNITAFGGDPDNVTLFGQSAGAGSISCLMIADGTERLFHRAILQSAPLELWTPNREEMVQALGNLAHERLSLDTRPRTSEEMLSLQTELLLAAKLFRSGQLSFGPLLGYAPLPNHTDIPERVRLAAQRIPIMLGYTEDEGVPFVRMNETLRPYLALPLIGGLVERVATWFVSGKVFTWLTDSLHTEYLRAGGQSSLCRFYWYPSQSSWRATHCIELPCLLGSWATWKDAPMLQDECSRAAVEDFGREDEGHLVWLCSRHRGKARRLYCHWK